MPETKTEQYLIVEQSVEALLGSEPASFAELVEDARELEDPNSMAAILREHVEQHPEDVGALEALAILCFADAKLARRIRFRLVSEGRRLSGLVQQAGKTQRAQEILEALARRAPGNRGVEKDLAAAMRRTGNVDRLIERYLSRAEEAEAAGRRRDSITWLREVLMLDSSRRDVARMIRDLQYESRRVKEDWRRRLRVVGSAVVMLGIAFGVVARELHIRSEFASIPAAKEGNRESLEYRLANLDTLIEGNPLWLGMFKAGRERSDLRVEIERIHAREAEQARQEADLRAERKIMAESAGIRARQMVANLDFESAVEQYELALRHAPQEWDQRGRVTADLEAVREHLKELSR